MCINNVTKIHKIFNKSKRYNYGDLTSLVKSGNEIKNGIYVFFEKGEKYGKYDRIVRIGTVTEADLISRIKTHYTGNKNASSFFKNVGRALIEKDVKDGVITRSMGTSILELWNSTKSLSTDPDIIHYTDKVKEYMSKNYTFTILSYNEEFANLDLEKKLLSTLNKSQKFQASKEWLGNLVPRLPKNHVQESRMWVSDDIDGDIITNNELSKLNKVAKK